MNSFTFKRSLFSELLVFFVLNSMSDFFQLFLIEQWSETPSDKSVQKQKGQNSSIKSRPDGYVGFPASWELSRQELRPNLECAQRIKRSSDSPRKSSCGTWISLSCQVQRSQVWHVEGQLENQTSVQVGKRSLSDYASEFYIFGSNLLKPEWVSEYKMFLRVSTGYKRASNTV